MNIQKTVSFFGMLLIIALVIMGVVKIWSPDAISNESFVKLVVTFGILAIGSILINLLSGRNSSTEKDES